MLVSFVLQRVLGVHIVNITYLTECLVCEVTIKKKKGYVAVAYRSPSQNISEFCPFYLVWETCLVIYFVQNPNSPSF